MHKSAKLAWRKPPNYYREYLHRIHRDYSIFFRRSRFARAEEKGGAVSF
jgi:hypothetical protein